MIHSQSNLELDQVIHDSFPGFLAGFSFDEICACIHQFPFTPLLHFQEVNFNMLDTREGGLLKSVEQLLSDIFIPTLRKMNHGWGDAATSQAQAQAVKQDFISSLEGFVSVLAGAQESLQERVKTPSEKPQAKLTWPRWNIRKKLVGTGWKVVLGSLWVQFLLVWPPSMCTSWR